MQLQQLELYSRFRGLQPGFKVVFTRPQQPVNKINPFCLVGLNGSGKSNLMQVLAEIFYYLELYVLPEAQDYFDPTTSYGFYLQYRLPVTPRNFLTGIDDPGWISTLTWRNVAITKKEKEEPVFEFWYQANTKRIAPKEITANLLPNQIIGYSSGMNEQVSTPFLKMDFYYLTMMRRKMRENNQADDGGNESRPANTGDRHTLTVNRLFYLDYHSNALMLLANHLSTPKQIGKKNELDIINDIVGVFDLVSFRIAINYSVKEEDNITELIKKLLMAKQEGEGRLAIAANELLKMVEIPPRINDFINALMDCSTTLRILTEKDLAETGSDTRLRLEMYFKVDEEMKRAFGDKVRGGAMHLFQQFYLLNLLNIDNYSKEVQEEIKDSNKAGSNFKAVLTRVADEDKVFHIDGIRLKKKNGATIQYAQLSDGEHQYIQVAGALKLMNENASLFLMDEPETHFNPEWRSTLFSTLNNILKCRLENDPGSFVPVQEIIVTSHSPFIVSDCQPEQVYMFERNVETGAVMQPVNPGFNTYGASANMITAKVFRKKETIAGLANEQLVQLKEDVEKGIKTNDQAMKELNQLGDSIEKILFIDSLTNPKKKS